MGSWTRWRSKLRLRFWRWHRRIGLLAAAFVVLLALTGLALNHSQSLGLDDRHLSAGWLQNLYGVTAPSITSFSLDGNWLSQVAAGELYRGTQTVGTCDGELVGAVSSTVESLGRIWLLACRRELILLLPGGEVVERIDPAYDLPTPISDLGTCGESYCFQAGGTLYRLDMEQLSWAPATIEPFSPSRAKEAPAPVRDALHRAHADGVISWERLLLDLHSGRLFGAWGPWLMDAMAILFVVLALTGVTMWSVGRHR